MKIKFAAALVAAATAVSLTPSAASAEPLPSNCRAGIGYNAAYSWANCTGGAGYVRAIATCSNGSYTVKSYGSWQWVGTQSEAHCAWGYATAVAASYDIKAY
ncbi:hypothetical protein [Nonomuraea sp. NPDC049607]|uniref:hypothetical protein n=1 Tax=Nonomuraea sp. NPDC049607 TaxID=3154732 RepID=UPI0034395C3F